MKKLKGEFLTQKEANAAIDKISSYCSNIKLINNYTNDSYYDYDNYMPDDGMFYYPETNIMNFGGMGGFGMISNWGYNPSVLENKYGHTFSRFYQSLYNPSGRVTMEAEVADDNFEYVKNQLYSYGAVTVM